jgi:hypothetical protein
MRSITDALTNQVVFSTPQVRDWLPELLRSEGKLPADFAPAFLHEATHHWCFSAPVQTVVTVLAMRGRAEALLAIEAATPGERAHWERRAAEDLIRADTALELYRPLAEGLATFTEFDVFPARFNRLLPAPLEWAVRFYGEGAKTERNRRPLTLAQLGQIRLGDDVRRRKESLLAQPLSCQDGGGYLAGYMTVKNLWRGSRRDGPWTADRFLQAAYRWFYEDEELVSLLLDTSMRAPESVTAIYRRMAGRVVDGIGHGEWLASEYPDHVQGTADGAAESASGLAARWHAAFAGLPIDLTEPPASGAAMFAGMASLGMQSRDLMLIGTMPCTADVRAGQARIRDGDRDLTTLTTGDASDRDGVPVTLSVYFATRGGQRVITAAGTGSALICWSTEPEWPSYPLERFWSRKTAIVPRNQSALSALVQGMRAYQIADRVISARSKELGALREPAQVDGYRRQTLAMVDDLYRECALCDVSPKQSGAVWSRMRGDGFYGLLDRDADKVRLLALAGLYSSSGVLDDEGTFRKMDMTPAEALATLRPYAKRYGVFSISDHITRPFEIPRVSCSI